MPKSAAPAVVWITKPKAKQAPLTDALSALGFNTRHVPTLEVQLHPENLLLQKPLFKKMKMAIFVSQAAVEAFLLALETDKKISFSEDTLWFGVGRNTAQQLETLGRAYGVGKVAYPQVENSEGLLALEALQQVEGYSLVIFRGKTGRSLLADTMQLRGARVDSLECYETLCPQYSEAELEALWQSPPSAIVTTSNQVLQNLIELTPRPHKAALFKTPLVVVSQRGRALAIEQGFDPGVILQATGAHTHDLVAALTEFYRNK